jgi:hypothetical protein
VLLLLGVMLGAYLHERALRRGYEMLWVFVRNSDTVQDYREELEQAVRDPQLVDALHSALSDTELRTVRRKLSDPALEAEWPALRPPLTNHAARAAVQTWVESRFEQSDRGKVFAWFVQDDLGLQLARSPVGNDNIGKNYAWRTYFHGGETDFRDLLEYLEAAHAPRLMKTTLSEPFTTETTNQDVIAVSTPVERDGRFLGVVGVFLYIHPPEVDAAVR